jgi:hypothetical protein
MRIRTNALQIGMIMASGEEITKLVILFHRRAGRLPKKVVQVHLNSWGKPRLAEWNYNGTVTIQNPTD